MTDHEPLTDKKAAELGVDARTYHPKKDMIEAIMKIHSKTSCDCVNCREGFREELTVYLKGL